MCLSWPLGHPGAPCQKLITQVKTDWAKKHTQIPKLLVLIPALSYLLARAGFQETSKKKLPPLFWTKS